MKRSVALLLGFLAISAAFAQNKNNGNRAQDEFQNNQNNFVQKKNLIVEQSLYIFQNSEFRGESRTFGLSYFNSPISVGSFEAPTETLDIFGNSKTRGTHFTQNLNVEFSGIFGEDVTIGRDLSVTRYGNFSRVGIGITGVPTEALDVNGNAKISDAVYSNEINAVTGNFSGDVNIEGSQFTNSNAIIRGNVGIGVEAPLEKLEIAGNAKVSENITSLSINANQATFEQTTSTEADILNALRVGGVTTLEDQVIILGQSELADKLTVDGDGIFNSNVGIGVVAPVEKLEIAGNVKVSDNVTSESVNAVQGTYEDLSSTNVDITNTLTVGGATTLNNSLSVSGDAGFSSDLSIGGNNLVSGNVGIGVASPVEKLEVAGNVKVSDNMTSQSVNAVQGTFEDLFLTNADITNTLTVGGATTLNNSLSVSGNAGFSSDLSIGGNNLISGNVGIGVASPVEKLEVAGNVKVSDNMTSQSVNAVQATFEDLLLTNADITNTLTVGGATSLEDMLTVAGNTTLSSDLGVGGDNIISGNLGVGVVSPVEKVEVAGNVKVSQTVTSKAVVSESGDFEVLELDDANITKQLTVNGATTLNNTLSVTGKASLAADLSVSGNIGIGVSDPSEKLDIAGNISASGNLMAADGVFSDDLSVSGDLSVSSKSTFTGAVTADEMVVSELTMTGKVTINSLAANEDHERFLVTDANGNIHYRELDTFVSFKEEEGVNNVAIEEGKTFSVGTQITPPGFAMAIGGDMITSEITIKRIEDWPDYVFEEDYELRSLEEVEDHIKKEGHLPEVPSEAEVKSDGIKQGEMNALLLKKIEELTLYVIDLKKENEAMKKLIKAQE